MFVGTVIAAREALTTASLFFYQHSFGAVVALVIVMVHTSLFKELLGERDDSDATSTAAEVKNSPENEIIIVDENNISNTLNVSSSLEPIRVLQSATGWSKIKSGVSNYFCIGVSLNGTISMTNGQLSYLFSCDGEYGFVEFWKQDDKGRLVNQSNGFGKFCLEAGMERRL